jgi:hypothetical protein
MGCCCFCEDNEDDDVIDFEKLLDAKVRTNGKRKVPSIIPEEESKAGTSHGDESLMPSSFKHRIEGEDDFHNR